MNDKQKRASRRKETVKKKNKFKKLLKDKFHKKNLAENKKFIGKLESTHGVSCSCSMCGNPRKYFKRKTLQEIKFNDKTNQETNDQD